MIENTLSNSALHYNTLFCWLLLVLCYTRLNYSVKTFHSNMLESGDFIIAC